MGLMYIRKGINMRIPIFNKKAFGIYTYRDADNKLAFMLTKEVKDKSQWSVEEVKFLPDRGRSK